jgi:DNA invertase Pin-like site-specific DNA recombinase
MNGKVQSEHLHRRAIVYVRQSTPGQVVNHTEGQRHQYALAEKARAMGFASVDTIDDDLGRSGSGLVERPGFQRLVALVCGAEVGAVFCLEASRLARNGRDWHHMIDLCALVGTLVIDADGIYDPRLINDRLLLGLKGTMSEYELSLLRQRSQAARESLAQRGELRFGLPAGYCWDEIGRIQMEPDQRVVEALRLVFRKFHELGSARQVLRWAHAQALQIPVMSRGAHGWHVGWQLPAHHNILSIVHNPTYAGAYVFGRTETRTRLVEGRARKTAGHRKPAERWNVLLGDHHPGYITWPEFERNQRMLEENAHMNSQAARKSARGGRALLTGLLRCGRCGRMLRLAYGRRAHRYQCRGAEHHAAASCIGIGGVRTDQAVSLQLLEAVAPHAIAAALKAAARARQQIDDVCGALTRELEDARYEARLAERRYQAVDPDQRLVARELEARWEAALRRSEEIEARLAAETAGDGSPVPVDIPALMALAYDLPAVWNAPAADMSTKQRIVRILIQEIVVDVDTTAAKTVLAIHWTGGRHTEVRLARVRRHSPTPNQSGPSAAEVIRKLGGHWSDRSLAVTMNRMRCGCEHGRPWTAVRVRELRERLGIAEFDPSAPRPTLISADEAARQLSIGVGSVYQLIRDGVLPGTQLLPCAPWQIPLEALQSEAVRIGVRRIVERRPSNFARLQGRNTLRLPGM